MLRVRRLDDRARLPTRAHPGDAGLDLYALEHGVLAPGERRALRTGLAVEVPDGQAGLVLPRSGLAARHGVTLVNATLSEQWNGSGWQVRSSPNPGGANFAGLNSVSCTGPTACMATGGGASGEGESGFTLAESWNGTSWSLVRSPSPGSFSDELRGVSCTSPGSCMAVGEFESTGNQFTLAEAWNGTHWTTVKTPHP